jgi:hypothetical protein
MNETPEAPAKPMQTAVPAFAVPAPPMPFTMPLVSASLPAPIPSAADALEIESPPGGGSYICDPTTGKLALVSRTEPGPELGLPAADAVKPATKE